MVVFSYEMLFQVGTNLQSLLLAITLFRLRVLQKICQWVRYSEARNYLNAR